MANKIYPPKKDLYPNGICPKHLKKLIPCIEEDFYGCVMPYPHPGVHVIYMCPDCWKKRQEIRSLGGIYEK